MTVLLSIVRHVPVAGGHRMDLRTWDLDADELSLQALFLDLRERLLPDEVCLLAEIDEPAQTYFVGVVFERHVGPVIQDATLDPPNLRGRDWADVVFLPGFHDPVPELDASTAVRQIHLVADLGRPTGPRDDDRNAANFGAHEIVVTEVEDRATHEILQDVL